MVVIVVVSAEFVLCGTSFVVLVCVICYFALWIWLLWLLLGLLRVLWFVGERCGCLFEFAGCRWILLVWMFLVGFTLR